VGWEVVSDPRRRDGGGRRRRRRRCCTHQLGLAALEHAAAAIALGLDEAQVLALGTAVARLGLLALAEAWVRHDWVARLGCAWSLRAAPLLFVWCFEWRDRGGKRAGSACRSGARVLPGRWDWARACGLGAERVARAEGVGEGGEKAAEFCLFSCARRSGWVVWGETEAGDGRVCSSCCVVVVCVRPWVRPPKVVMPRRDVPRFAGDGKGRRRRPRATLTKPLLRSLLPHQTLPRRDEMARPTTQHQQQRP
jgi:hypothetical protein